MKTIAIVFLLLIFHVSRAQTMDWVSLPEELDGQVFDMTVYNGKLIAAGTFTSSGNTVLNSIAAWDGSHWSNLGNGLKRGGHYATVYKMLVFNSDLYVVGLFDTAGTVSAQNIAKWNGTAWSSLNNVVTSTIYTIAEFNNEIYVGGNFLQIENVWTKSVARYDGTTWHALANGIDGTPSVRNFYKYHGLLYVAGLFNSVSGMPANDICAWDGSNWHALPSNNADSPGMAMITWNNNLLFANFVSSSATVNAIGQYDGNQWSIFCNQSVNHIYTFYIFNNNLYCCTQMGPVGTDGNSEVYVWSEALQTWNMVGTGVNAWVSTLCSYNGELYCGGSFKTSNHSSHNYIAKLSTLTGLKPDVAKISATVFPNPVTDKLVLALNDQTNVTTHITLSNLMGQQLIKCSAALINNKTELDLKELPAGIYYLQVQNEKGSSCYKVIKE